MLNVVKTMVTSIYGFGASAAGVSLEGGRGHPGTGPSGTAADLLRQTALRVCASSPPRLPYHLGPAGSRLVERMGAGANMSNVCRFMWTDGARW
jgi:hypothetical protein